MIPPIFMRQEYDGHEKNARKTKPMLGHRTTIYDSICKYYYFHQNIALSLKSHGKLVNLTRAINEQNH